MEITAPLESNNIFLVQPDVMSKIRGIVRHNSTMAARVKVARLDSQRKSDEDDFCVFQVVHELFGCEQGLDPCKQLFGVDRLVQEIIGAGFNGADVVITLA